DSSGGALAVCASSAGASVIATGSAVVGAAVLGAGVVLPSPGASEQPMRVSIPTATRLASLTRVLDMSRLPSMSTKAANLRSGSHTPTSWHITASPWRPTVVLQNLWIT